MSFFRRFFGKTGWDAFPPKFITDLKRVLGEDGFQNLTHLSKKHQILKEPLFSHPASFDMGNEMTILSLSGFLTSMGNEMLRQHHVDDAENAFRIALSINQDWFSARYSLALTLACTQRLEDAERFRRLHRVDAEWISQDAETVKRITEELIDRLRELLPGKLTEQWLFSDVLKSSHGQRYTVIRRFSSEEKPNNRI